MNGNVWMDRVAEAAAEAAARPAPEVNDQVIFVDDRWVQHAAVVVAINGEWADIAICDGGEVWQVPVAQIAREEDMD